MNRRSVAPPLLAFLLALLLVPTALAAADSAADPWTALAELRAALQEDSPLQARFVQTLLPEGFDQGEEESGVLSIGLPECLRWEYEGDFPKSFLLCGTTVYHWTPGDTLGDLYPIEDERSPGLDFFLLGVDELRSLYTATTRRDADGSLILEMVPRSPSPEIRALEAVLEPGHRRLRSLSYVDEGGTRTTFVLGETTGGAPAELFHPPDDIEWHEP